MVGDGKWLCLRFCATVSFVFKQAGNQGEYHFAAASSRIRKDFLKEAGCARTSTAEVSQQIATVRTETPYSLEEEHRMMGPVR